MNIEENKKQYNNPVIETKIDFNMSIEDLGRYCSLKNKQEIVKLEENMDFRLPEYRREVFLRFYEFHLKYKSHPGAVYYVMSYLAKVYKMSFEEKLWFAFINGCTQNPVTSLVLFERFPDFEKIDLEEMETWHRKYWKHLDYDIDRRYQKGHFVEMVEDYKKHIGEKTQEEFFKELMGKEETPFRGIWNYVKENFFMYGRLSTFSYLEYLKIMGLKIDCDDLFIYDKSGSKSHRNGICIVCGRDDLDWRKDNIPIMDLKGHTKEIMEWVEEEGKQLLEDAKERFKGEEFFEDVGYFTLESTLCCYKSWHRNNRRYPNVYNDMFHDRIKKAEQRDWSEIDGKHTDFNVFWEARKEYLPKKLRLEDNPNDPGLVKVKQNWYRKTGQVIMMEDEWSCFKNDFFKYIVNDHLNDW